MKTIFLFAHVEWIFFDDVMQDLFEKKTFSVFEMIFRQKVENFCCVIETRDDD